MVDQGQQERGKNTGIQIVETLSQLHDFIEGMNYTKGRINIDFGERKVEIRGVSEDKAQEMLEKVEALLKALRENAVFSRWITAAQGKVICLDGWTEKEKEDGEQNANDVHSERLSYLLESGVVRKIVFQNNGKLTIDIADPSSLQGDDQGRMGPNLELGGDPVLEAVLQVSFRGGFSGYEHHIRQDKEGVHKAAFGGGVEFFVGLNEVSRDGYDIRWTTAYAFTAFYKKDVGDFSVRPRTYIKYDQE